MPDVNDEVLASEPEPVKVLEEPKPEPSLLRELATAQQVRDVLAAIDALSGLVRELALPTHADGVKNRIPKKKKVAKARKAAKKAKRARR